MKFQITSSLSAPINILTNKRLCSIIFLILCASEFTSSANVAAPFGYVGKEMGDYRLPDGEPFVTLFEHENYRGKIYRQKINRECSNVPYTLRDWTSSILLHGRCVTLCDRKNCEGKCHNLYPNTKGVKRLAKLGLNDKAKSLRFCYQSWGYEQGRGARG